MKRKLLSMILCVCLALSLLPAPALAAGEPTSLDISAGSITISATGYTAGGATSETTYTGDYTITGTTTANSVTVTGGTHNITIDGLSITLGTTYACAFYIKAGATVNLTLTGTNVLTSGNTRAGLEVPSGATLNVLAASTGSLTATGTVGGAGIGGCDKYSYQAGNSNAGTITVAGGTITAQGGDTGAGIGGGTYGAGGSLTVTGGTVTATGGTGGSHSYAGGQGIGHGSSTTQGTTPGTSGTVNISGGTVTANGGHTCAGIGGNNVTISGGIVTATGANASAGIGGDCGYAGGTVTITGGTVTANGGNDESEGHGAAGIGGGYRANGGTTVIDGGNVKAVKSTGAADIGAGAEGTDAGTVKNSAGTDVSLTTVTLESITSQVCVNDLSIYNSNNTTYSYGGTDLYTDTSGKLYLYLPTGTTVKEATALGNTYTGGVAAGASGTLTIPSAVASVNTDTGLPAYYSTLSEALTAAADASGSTLKLLKNVSDASAMTVSTAMTLDLNGKTLAFTGTNNISMSDGADLTIRDSAGSGAVTAAGDALDVSGGKLSVAGGSFTGGTGKYGLNVTGGTVQLTGGTYSSVNSSTTIGALLPDGYTFYAGTSASGTTESRTSASVSDTVTVGEIDWSKAVTHEDNTHQFYILSADGLRWIADVANGTVTADTYANDPSLPSNSDFRADEVGNTTYRQYVVLNNDIDLSEKTWTPISSFEGVFSGSGHSITDMTVNTDDANAGLFGNLKGIVRNLTISGSVTASAASAAAGGICGTLTGGTNIGKVENCVSHVAVTASGSVAYAGGLVGCTAFNAIVSNCISDGTVSAANGTAGTLIGSADIASVTNCYASSGKPLGGTSSVTLNSVGTYASDGTLTATNSTSLSYGSSLNNAVKYWINRQDKPYDYVLWTTDAVPSLTTTYAAIHTHTWSDFVKQQDGSYLSTCPECGLTRIPAATLTVESTETPYADILSAVTAMMTAQKGTLKLLQDVSTGSQALSVEYGNYTVNLNGHTWTSSASVGISIGGASKNIYLTIEDTAGGGKMVNTGNSATLLNMNSGNLKLTGGSFESGSTIVTVTGGKLDVTGGSYTGALNLTGIAADNIGDIQLSGGTFSGAISTATGVPVGALLKSGYAYKTTASSSTWVSDVSASSISGVSVAEAPLTITAQPASPTAVDYGYAEGPSLSVSAKATNSQNAITYQWYKNNAAIDGATSASYTVPAGLDAGSYAYTCAVTCEGYTLTSSAATFTVNGISCTVSNANYPSSFTYTGSAVTAPAAANFTSTSSGAMTFAWYTGTDTTATPLTGAPTNAGTYTLKASVAATNNYAAASTTVPVTINPATPALAWASTTQSVVYSGSAVSVTAPTVTLLSSDTYSGTFSYSYKASGAQSYTAGLPTDTGTYTVKAHIAASGNYTAADSGEMSLTVTAKTVTSPTITLAGDSFTYSGSAQTPAVSTVKDGETTIAATEYTVSYSSNTAAGTATVTISDKTGGNYTVSGSKTFTIGKKAVTVQPKDISVTVGNTPTLTLAYTGLVGSETITPSETPAFTLQNSKSETVTLADAVKATGSYTITWTNMGTTDFSSIENYTVTKAATGTLTVSAASRGSSSDSGTTVTVPVSSNEGSVRVDATVKNGTAAVTITDAQIKAIASGKTETGTVKLDVSTLSVSAATVPAKIITAANSSSSSTGVEVALPTGTVTLDKTALAAVTDKGGDLTVSVDKVDNTKLTEAQKAVLGSQTETALVVDVNILTSGKKISAFGGGSVSVAVPYTPKASEDTSCLVVWFLNDDGSIEPKTGSYNAKTGMFEFQTEHMSQYVLVSFPFKDVPAASWYYGSVGYTYMNGLFAGTSETTFSPEETMSRAMLVTVLWRMAGSPAASGTDSFSDVSAGQWYTDAIRWAASEKIVTGYGNDCFGTNDPVTREQAAAILYRYAQFKSLDTSAVSELTAFADEADVSAYAVSPLKWAVGAKLVNGSEGRLLPQAGATRAQVAAILTRYCQNIVK